MTIPESFYNMKMLKVNKVINDKDYVIDVQEKDIVCLKKEIHYLKHELNILKEELNKK